MIHRVSQSVRANLVAYLALLIAVLGSGGSYAVAATAHRSSKKRPTTIAACANNRTGELTLPRSRRCSRGHRRVTWSIKGPKGATGAVGAPAPSIYAAVDASFAEAGLQSPAENGLLVTRTGPGIFSVTITNPICAIGENVPVVTPTDDYLSGEPIPPPGATPVAFLPNNLGISSQFTVDTGYTANGSFTPESLDFDILDSCHPSGSSKASR